MCSSLNLLILRVHNATRAGVRWSCIQRLFYALLVWKWEGLGENKISPKTHVLRQIPDDWPPLSDHPDWSSGGCSRTSFPRKLSAPRERRCLEKVPAIRAQTPIPAPQEPQGRFWWSGTDSLMAEFIPHTSALNSDRLLHFPKRQLPLLFPHSHDSFTSTSMLPFSAPTENLPKFHM